MGKFLLKRIVNLEKFGWNDCTIELQAATYNEIVEWQKKYGNIKNDDTNAQTEVFDIVKDKFISGTALDDTGKKVDITKEDIGDLPLDIMLECIASFRGTTPDPE